MDFQRRQNNGRRLDDRQKLVFWTGSFEVAKDTDDGGQLFKEAAHTVRKKKSNSPFKTATSTNRKQKWRRADRLFQEAADTEQETEMVHTVVH